MRKLKHEEIARTDPAKLDLLRKHPISVVIDNVRSIHNVGSIFRTSDAALVERIYVTGISGTPENRALHKTALGAQDTVDWEYVREASEIVMRLKRAGYTIAVLEITDAPAYPSDLDSSHFPLCLVVGNEIFGVSDESIALADIALEIPQFGAKQSLNVSVAFGIAVFDVVRRYRKLQGLPMIPSQSELEAER